MARVEICEHCGRKWPVSKLRDISRMYLCPECEARILGKEIVYVVWLDDEAARLRN
jgi:DNA-directed RNA polymerase subunit RPC12/RpoP